MRLYFIRHGQSEANLTQTFSNRGWQHPLTPLGRSQAQTLAGRLGGAGIACIYTSPLMRAVQTAEILVARLTVPIEITPALNEFDCGENEGCCDPQAWARFAELRTAWLERGAWEQRIPGGESFRDIEARFLPFIAGLESRHGAQARLALVSHGGLYHCMLPVLLANIDFAFSEAHPLVNCAWSAAEISGASRVCLEWDGVVR